MQEALCVKGLKQKLFKWESCVTRCRVGQECLTIFFNLVASDGLYYNYKSFTQQFTVQNNILCALDSRSCCHCRIEHLVLSFFNGKVITSHTEGGIHGIFVRFKSEQLFIFSPNLSNCLKRGSKSRTHNYTKLQSPV